MPFQEDSGAEDVPNLLSARIRGSYSMDGTADSSFLYHHLAHQPIPMAKKAKNSARGNRYTPQQKAEILAYVDKVNAEKGRGGAAAASRKFKISQITIGHWIKISAGSQNGDASSSVTVSSQDFARTLKRLKEVHEEIAKKEAELDSLRSEYSKLKRSL